MLCAWQFKKLTWSRRGQKKEAMTKQRAGEECICQGKKAAARKPVAAHTPHSLSLSFSLARLHRAILDRDCSTFNPDFSRFESSSRALNKFDQVTASPIRFPLSCQDTAKPAATQTERRLHTPPVRQCRRTHTTNKIQQKDANNEPTIEAATKQDFGWDWESDATAIV